MDAGRMLARTVRALKPVCGIWALKPKNKMKVSAGDDNIMKMMRKLTPFFLSFMFLITSCSNTVSIDNGTLNESTIALNQDGKTEQGIVWDFSKDYYDAEELETYITESIDEFHNESGKDNMVSLEYMKEINDKIHVTMAFDSVKTYADFNQEEAQFMKLPEAVEAGLIPEVVESADKTGAVEVSTLGDGYYAAVWKGDYQLMVEGEILYYANGILLDDNVIKTSTDDVTIAIFH